MPQTNCQLANAEQKDIGRSTQFFLYPRSYIHMYKLSTVVTPASTSGQVVYRILYLYSGREYHILFCDLYFRMKISHIPFTSHYIFMSDITYYMLFSSCVTFFVFIYYLHSSLKGQIHFDSLDICYIIKVIVFLIYLGVIILLQSYFWHSYTNNKRKYSIIRTIRLFLFCLYELIVILI